MQNLDAFSYQCGVIDCFNEMVYAGVKSLALSRPMDSAAERDALVPFSRESCGRYGNQLYIEDEPLLTDLFPISMNLGKHNMLFYRADHILEQYLRLKRWKAALVREKVYFGGNRSSDNHKVSVAIRHLCIQRGGQIKFLLCQIFLYVLVLNG